MFSRVGFQFFCSGVRPVPWRNQNGMQTFGRQDDSAKDDSATLRRLGDRRFGDKIRLLGDKLKDHWATIRLAYFSTVQFV